MKFTNQSMQLVIFLAVVVLSRRASCDAAKAFDKHSRLLFHREASRSEKLILDKVNANLIAVPTRKDNIKRRKIHARGAGVGTIHNFIKYGNKSNAVNTPETGKHQRAFLRNSTQTKTDEEKTRRTRIWEAGNRRSFSRKMAQEALSRGYDGGKEYNEDSFKEFNYAPTENYRRSGSSSSSTGSSTSSSTSGSTRGCDCGSVPQSTISTSCDCGQPAASYVNNFCQTGPSMGHDSMSGHEDCQTPIDSGFMQTSPSHMHVGSTHHVSHPAKHFHKDVQGKETHEAYSTHTVSENQCWNGGVLVYINNQGGTGCICDSKYMGNRCHEVNPCYKKPCKCGTCSSAGQGKFVCVCCPEAIGPTCAKVNPCPPNYCGDNGVCSHDGVKPSCNCMRGFTGAKCETMNSCYPSPCQNDAQCVLQGTGGYQCLCKPTWHGGTCGSRNKCAENPCKNSGKCLERGEDFECTCPVGYKGKSCDEKPCSPNPCSNGGVCNELTSGHTCQCPQYALGYNCDKTSPCNAKPCQNSGKCIDSMSGYQWQGTKTEYVCICPVTYSGDHCQDTKSVRPNCHPDAHIENNQCVCDEGFIGDGVRTCDKIHVPCTPNPCLNDGVCSPSGSNYECKCTTGFSGAQCQVADPCEPNPCNGHSCLASSETGYTCKCRAGSLGKNCQDVDECETKKPCKNGGICAGSKTGPRFTCGCQGKWSGYTCTDCKCAGGAKCDPSGKCVCESDQMFVNGKCISRTVIERQEREEKEKKKNAEKAVEEQTKKDKEAKADAGKPVVCDGSHTGKDCKAERWCVRNNPCRNGGTCIENAQNVFQACVCVGSDQDPKNYCIKREIPNPCQNGGVHVPLDVGFDCKCLARYTGGMCEVDKCVACSKDATCTYGECKCKEGFYGNGYQCLNDIKVLCSGTQCDDNAVCTKGICECEPGYTGDGIQCEGTELIHHNHVLPADPAARGATGVPAGHPTGHTASQSGSKRDGGLSKILARYSALHPRSYIKPSSGYHKK